MTSLALKALVVEEYVANGLTRREIAEKCGISRQYVASIIRIYYSKELILASTRSKYAVYMKLKIAEMSNLTITYKSKSQ